MKGKGKNLRFEDIKRALEGKPENVKKFLRWFWKREKYQPFKFKSLDTLSDMVQKTWPVSVKEKRTEYLWFVLKDLNIKIVIEAFPHTTLYFIYIYPSIKRSGLTMRMYLRNHEEILKLIKKLYEHGITGKVLRQHFPDPPMPYAKWIPSSIKGVNAKVLSKRLMKSYNRDEKKLHAGKS